MGAYEEKYEDFYDRYLSFGYELRFRQHSEAIKSRKKGNVDTDVVFQMLFDSFYEDEFDKIILVSWDGDYFKTIQHLLKINRLEKVLLPSHKNASSLYKALDERYKAFLDKANLKRRIQNK